MALAESHWLNRWRRLRDWRDRHFGDIPGVTARNQAAARELALKEDKFNDMLLQKKYISGQTIRLMDVLDELRGKKERSPYKDETNEDDPWIAAIKPYLERNAPSSISAAEAAAYLCGCKVIDVSRRDHLRAASILKMLGWVRFRVSTERREVRYRRPAEPKPPLRRVVKRDLAKIREQRLAKRTSREWSAQTYQRELEEFEKRKRTTEGGQQINPKTEIIL